MAFVAILSSCSPDSFEGADPNGIPSLDGVEPVVTVDQSINQVTFSLPADLKGVMPIWVVTDASGKQIDYSTVNGLKKIYTNAGDYQLAFKLMNRNGVSDGSKTFTFHIDDTLVKFDKYFTMLCGGKENSSKEWRIDNDKQGHLGCGEPNTTGLNWWSAAPNDKKDWNVYDSRMTFTATGDASKGGYHFNPGASGQIYVNKDVLAMGGPAAEDFCVDAPEQEVEFEFEVEGNDVFLVFPEHTYFPYIANDDIWNTPRYKVESITPSEINLVIDNGGIAWHYILTSGAAATVFNGFKYDSEFNMWKAADAAHTYTQYNACTPSWSPATTPEVTDNHDGQYSFTLVEETAAQWQSQFAIVPDAPIALSSANHYDYSVIINPTNNIDAATVKLTEDGNDSNFLFEQKVALTAYEDNVIWFYDLPGIDAAKVKMVFDFAPAPANTTVTIKNIVVKDHANDDGTVLPSDEPGDNPGGGDVQPLDPNSPANLWTDYALETWYSPGDWSGGLNPDIKAQSKNEYTVVVPAGVGGGEWQGQNKLTIPVATPAGQLYDFGCVFTSSESGTITVKLADANDDSNHAFFYENAVEVKAYENVTFKKLGIQTDGGDYEKVMLIIDYGRLPAGTEITAKDFVFQEHQLAASDLTWDMPGNLWASANVTCDWWYSAGDWSGALNPTVNSSNAPREYVFTMPDGIGGSEWQGQTKFHTDIAASASKSYHFSVTLNSSETCEATVKLAWEGNDNDHAFFYVNNVKLDAYTDVQFTQFNVSPDVDYDKVVLFVDLGRTPAGADVTIKDFVLVEN